MKSIAYNKSETLNPLVSFCYAYIGLMSGLFIFRKAFKFLDYIYVLCMICLGIRSINFCLQNPLSDWTFVIKPYLLVISLLASFQLKDFSFLIKNLTAIASMLIMGMIFLKKPNKLESICFIKALKVCFVLNYIFASLQLIIIIIFKVNIFYYLGYYLHIYDSVNTDMVQNATRITGFIWDPYVLGMFCAVGFFIFTSKYMKLWVIILLYFSSSRAGQLGLLMACIIYYRHSVKRFLKKDCFALPLFFLTLFCIILCVPTIIDFLDLDRGFSRTSVGWRRVEYITKLPEVWSQDRNLLYIFFGGAPGYTGARYVLTSVDSMAKNTIFTLYWSVESDWFGILIGRGIVGFLGYFILHIKIILSKKSNLNRALVAAIFFGGIGYVYDTAIFSCFIVYFAGNFVDSITALGSIKPSKTKSIVTNH